MADKKPTIQEFLQQVRDNVQLPEGISDAELMKVIGNKKPGVFKGLDTSVARKKMAEPKEGFWHSFGSELGMTPEQWSGAAKEFKDHPVKGVLKQTGPGIIAGMAKSYGRNFGTAIKRAGSEAMAAHDSSGMESFGHGIQAVANTAAAPIAGVFGTGFLKAADKASEGDLKGAAGSFLGTAAPIAASMLGGGKPKSNVSSLSEMTAIGEGTKVNSAMLDIAKTMSKPESMALDSQIAEIDEALAKKGWKTGQKLAKTTEDARINIEKLERAPGAQVKDITAAKEAVDRLSSLINKGDILWPELRKSLVELRQASKTLGGGSSLKNNLSTITNTLEDELQSGATKSGYGGAYKKWRSDYRDLSRWQRAHAKVLVGQTASQMETRLTAKNSPSIRIAGSTPIRFGKSKLGKITANNSEMLQKSHGALNELSQRIKTKAPLTPSTTPGAATPKTPMAPAPQPVAPAGPAGTPGAPMPPVSGGSQGAKPPVPQIRIHPPAPPPTSITGEAKPVAPMPESYKMYHNDLNKKMPFEE